VRKWMKACDSVRAVVGSLSPGRNARRRVEKARKHHVETLESRMLLAADSLVISEILAFNETLETRGEVYDWVEIHNPGDEAVDLVDWSLTDDDGELNKWSFPAGATISAGGYFQVFTTGLDLTSNLGNLHTNFGLSRNGEYLALVSPEGDVVYEYDEFPNQFADTSYGIPTGLLNGAELLGEGDEMSVFVPSDNSLGDSWTAVGFDSSAWNQVTTPAGFGVEVPDLTVPGFTIRQLNSSIDIEDIQSADAALSGDRDGITSDTTYTGVPLIDFRTGTPSLTGNFDNDLEFPGGGVGSFTIRTTATLVVNTAGVYTFGTNLNDDGRLMIDGEIVIADKNSNADSDSLSAPLTLTAGIHTLDLVMYQDRGRAGGAELFVASGAQSQFSDAFKLLGDSAFSPISPFAVVLGEGVSDLSGDMLGINASAYTRSEFTVDNVDDVEGLALRVRYNDGFIAYLNGVEVARRNAPAGAAFDASATAARAVNDSLSTETIDISASRGELLPGDNVLAIQVLNVDANDSSLLISAELLASGLRISPPAYFATPTPNAANSDEAFTTVEDTAFSVDRGFYDEPFNLDISTKTEGATIRYTLDGSEPTDRQGLVYSGPLRISGTTVVRAFAYKQGMRSTNVDTQTYLFIEDIIRQSRSEAPLDFPTSNVNGQSLVYGMDQSVVNDPTWGPQLEEALKQVPTMSIVIDSASLFDRTSGIYTNPQRRGRDWERAGSLELINPDGSEGFQVGAGFRIRGGFSRSTGNPKHAFRVLFREEYGDSKLRFPLFGDDGVDEFDNIDLRTTQNYSWAFQNDSRNAFVRDIWSRDVQLALGHPSTRGEYYHLYINGQYWGLYQTEERPESSYAASYFGGEPEDWDVIKSTGSSGGYQREATDGTTELYDRLYNEIVGGIDFETYMRIQGKDTAGNRVDVNPDGTRNDEFVRLLDVENLIDYMIITYYTGDRDGPGSRFTNGPNNFFAIINREAPDGFQYIEHDSEHSLGTGDSNMVSPFDDPGTRPIQFFNPHWLHEQLMANVDDYAQQFASRVYKTFFNGGIFTAAAAIEFIDTRAAEFDMAIIAESARWGNNSNQTKNNWITAVQSTRNFINGRTTQVIGQLENVGWYGSVDPPIFEVNGIAQHGGALGAGDELTIDGARGDKWYTLDGSDPRLPNGDVSPTAIKSTGDPIVLTESTVVRTRLRSGRKWSVLNEAQFFVNELATSGNLVISELNYNPASPSSSEVTAGYGDNDLFEFIELLNMSNTPVTLSGLTISGGIGFDFSDGDVRLLDAGARVVVVRDRAAFTERYGSDVSVAGEYSGRLSNGGEEITLTGALDNLVQTLLYDDGGSWPGRADGDGASLELIDPAAPVVDADSWRSSSEFGGSPGAAGSGPFVDVIVNEVLSRTDLVGSDSIELLNTTDQAVDVSGWYLSDSSDNLQKFRIPDGTMIAAGGYAVFDESDFNPTPLGPADNHFALSGTRGDDVWLMATDADGNLARFADRVDFGAALDGVSLARIPNGSGRLVPAAQVTLGAANSEHRQSDVVISEVMYSPQIGDEVVAKQLEFVELYNQTAAVVDLTGWRLRKGVDFDFADGTTIAGGETLLIVNFDLNDPALRTQFEDAYQIDLDNVSVQGPYSDALSNTGETVQLQMADTPPVLEPDFTPHPMVDEVRYGIAAPWAASAAGGGDSLSKVAPGDYGNDSQSWTGAAPTPGSVDFAAPAPAISSVQVGGSTWSSEFFTQLGGSGYDITAPIVTPLLSTSGIDQITILFSEDVVVGQDDLTLTSVVSGELIATGFDYNAIAKSATWTYSELVQPDRLNLLVSDAIQTAAGVPLAAQKNYSFNVLVGDSTGDGEVDIKDLQALRAALLTGPGDLNYSVAADYNGSGLVDVRDIQILRGTLLTELPAEPLAATEAAFALLASDEAEDIDEDAAADEWLFDIDGLLDSAL